MIAAASKPRTGTREWSDISFNIGLGCSNNCRYCYAKADKLRRKMITCHEEWPTERLLKQAGRTSFPDQHGSVTMFPTTHDITPFYLPHYIKSARAMLAGGNNPLLIVSKPRFDCIKEVCTALKPWQQAVEFRFTIGTLDDDVSRFWEPGASRPTERLTCLTLAAGFGYRVSVSLEPMLGGAIDAYNVIRNVRRLVSPEGGTVWVGKMNNLRKRLDMTVAENRTAVPRIEELQADNRILELVAAVECQPELRRIVRWKDSIQQVITGALR